MSSVCAQPCESTPSAKNTKKAHSDKLRLIREQLRLRICMSVENPAVKRLLDTWCRDDLRCSYKTLRYISACTDKSLVDFIIKVLPIRDTVYTLVHEVYGSGVSVGTDGNIYVIAFGPHSVHSFALVMAGNPLPKCAKTITIGKVLTVCGTIVQGTVRPNMSLLEICRLFTYPQILKTIVNPSTKMAQMHNELVKKDIDSIYCPDNDILMVVHNAMTKFVAVDADDKCTIYKIHGKNVYNKDTCICWENVQHILIRYWQLSQIHASLYLNYEPPDIQGAARYRSMVPTQSFTVKLS